jgi:hypothetical protein
MNKQPDAPPKVRPVETWIEGHLSLGGPNKGLTGAKAIREDRCVWPRLAAEQTGEWTRGARASNAGARTAPIDVNKRRIAQALSWCDRMPATGRQSSPDFSSMFQLRFLRDILVVEQYASDLPFRRGQS